jgi:hypothetical protein
MSPEQPAAPHDFPLEELERTLIADFLAGRGYDEAALAALPAEARARLLKEAALHASTRLSEVEARSHLVHELHGQGRARKLSLHDYLRVRDRPRPPE